MFIHGNKTEVLSLSPKTHVFFPLICTFCITALACFGATANLPKSVSVDRPNVIWILLDACRAANLMPYGYLRQTSPIIQKIADEGTVFENHFSQSSKTMFSVPSYMTGQYFPAPCFSNSFSSTTHVWTPPEDEILITETLRNGGYHTAMFTNMPLFFETDRLSKSFDEVFMWGIGEHVLMQRWAVMNKKLHEWLSKHKSKPFFLYIHAADTHFPHEMVAPFDKWIDPDYDQSQIVSVEWGQDYRPKDGHEFTDEDRDFFRGYYDGMILDADTQIGLLLEQLRLHDILENTVIIVGADHGQLLGEDGCTMDHVGETDEVLHVPFILSGLGIPQGKRISDLTGNIDIVPTLVELLKLDSQATYHGQSMVPLLYIQKSENWRQEIYAIPDRIAYDNPLTLSVITADYKYWQFFDDSSRGLWSMPDSAQHRTNVESSHPTIKDSLAAALRNKLLPLYTIGFRSIPVESIVFESLWLAFNTDPDLNGDAIVFSMSRDMNTIYNEIKEGKNWTFHNGLLWGQNNKESLIPLTYTADVPNDKYNLYVNMLNCTDVNGIPASSILVQVQDEETPRLAIHSSLPVEESGITTTYLGKVSIHNDKFKFTLKGYSGYLTVLHSLQLIPDDVDIYPHELPVKQIFKSGDTQDGMEVHEIMRALGYL